MAKAKEGYVHPRDKYFAPKVSDPDGEFAEVPREVYNFYRYIVLWRHVNVEMVSKFRTQVVNSDYLEPIVRHVCLSFLRTGDMSLTEEQIQDAKKDLNIKTLRVGAELDALWEVWYDFLCKTVRAYEDKLPTITR